jgi:hypothetical protein
VTSPHAAVAKSEYSVEMQAGPAVVCLRYVAEQTQYLALLIDGDRAAPFGSQIEPSDFGAFERSDRRDRCRVNCLLIRKGCDLRKTSSPRSRIRTNVRPLSSEESLNLMSRPAANSDVPLLSSTGMTQLNWYDPTQ